jgi:DNA polymerase III epsilon subunit-like protein
MNNLIILDTETTGNDVAKDRLCQVCYKEGDTFHTGFFKPPIPISVKAMSITHITNKMVADKEPFAGSAMKQELEALLQDGILVAHNALFDKAILEAEGLVIPQFICTLRVARALDEDCVIPEYNLQFLRYYLDLDVDADAHDAEGDVRVLAAVFERLMAKIKQEGLSDDEAIAKMIHISTTPTLFKKFTFGKHNGKDIAEVAKTDKGYLQWLLGQKMAEGVADEDWIHTLQTYLR